MVQKSSRTFKGIPGSPGIAIGQAFLFQHETIHVDERVVPEKNLKLEVRKFKSAVTGVRRDLQKLQKRVEKQLGEENARIFIGGSLRRFWLF